MEEKPHSYAETPNPAPSPGAAPDQQKGPPEGSPFDTTIGVRLSRNSLSLRSLRLRSKLLLGLFKLRAELTNL
jgi:hypothetical protein